MNESYINAVGIFHLKIKPEGTGKWGQFICNSDLVSPERSGCNIQRTGSFAKSNNVITQGHFLVCFGGLFSLLVESYTVHLLCSLQAPVEICTCLNDLSTPFFAVRFCLNCSLSFFIPYVLLVFLGTSVPHLDLIHLGCFKTLDRTNQWLIFISILIDTRHHSVICHVMT